MLVWLGLQVVTANTERSSRVESLALNVSISVDLSALKSSIKRLQAASVRLDNEKDSAEKGLRELMRRQPHRHPLLRRLKKIVCRLAKSVGHECARGKRRELWRAAVERVRLANAALVAFERGFISEQGLQGREWYRHLGVAPGRWLGQLIRPSLQPCLTQ